MRTKPRTRRRQRAEQGFTLIEVFMALAVMVLGSAALLRMQGEIGRANRFARMTTTATNLAEVWAERLKADALGWRTPGTPTATTYLADIATPDTWLAPPADTSAGSRGFDYFGRDFAFGVVNTGLTYCVSYRLSWVLVGQLMRADVRVFWDADFEHGGLTAGDPRHGVAMLTAFGPCNAGLTPAVPVGDPNSPYHAVFLTTVVRFTPSNT